MSKDELRSSEEKFPLTGCHLGPKNNSYMSQVNMYSSRKNPYPPQGRSLEIPSRGGGLKSQNFRRKVCTKLHWNSMGGRGGGGCKKKPLFLGEYGYFLELNNPGQDATVLYQYTWVAHTEML